MEIISRIQRALWDENPLIKLEQLVYALSEQGLSRQNIYELVLRFHNDNMFSDFWIQTENKYNGDHPMDITLDRLSGYCTQYSILLGSEPFQNT